MTQIQLICADQTMYIATMNCLIGLDEKLLPERNAMMVGLGACVHEAVFWLWLARFNDSTGHK